MKTIEKEVNETLNILNRKIQTIDGIETLKSCVYYVLKNKLKIMKVIRQYEKSNVEVIVDDYGLNYKKYNTKLDVMPDYITEHELWIILGIKMQLPKINKSHKNLAYGILS